MSVPFSGERHALLADLRDAARRERRARRPLAVRAAVGAGLVGATGMSAALALTALGRHLAATQSASFEPSTLLWLCFSAAILAASAVGFVVLFRDQTPARVAARLDANPTVRGRVLPALELSSTQQPSAFEALAVLEGVKALRGAPAVEVQGSGPARGKWPAACALLLFLVAASLMPPRRVSLKDKTSEPNAAATHVSGASARHSSAPSAAPQAHPSAESRASNSLEAQQAGGAVAAAAPASDRPSASEAGRGRSAGSERANAAGASRGDATPGGAPPEGSLPTPTEQKPAKSGAPTRAQRQRESADNHSGATRGAGGSGGGSIAAVKSPWQQRDLGNDAAQMPNESGERIEDDPDEESARTGTQPGLKDRRRTVSRDLSISSTGSGGDGRGGPSLPKKARGTGSMVLGVPIPDFVRGLLNPGTTRITHERVAPVRRPSPPLPVTDVASRTGLAPRVVTEHVPAAWQELLSALQRARRKGGE